MTSTWYSASLLFEAQRDSSTTDGLWEESIVIVLAASAEAAQVAAEAVGRTREHRYRVDEPVPHEIVWRFVSVERVFEILVPDWQHGREIFSRYLDRDQVKSLQSPKDV